tara:strand:- start:665 stop:2302 length:1638 start_codon:yes stop_codon:yes gene_type:complete
MFGIQKPKKEELADLSMFPSEFVTSFMNIASGGSLSKFSFEGRKYLLPVYDTPARRVLLLCGRQVEKSTTLGNMILTHTMLQQHFRALFVSPTQQQTETFSRDRISSPIEVSPHLQVFTRGDSTKNNVLYKKFVTGSDLTLRYAFLHADRVRGISADMLLLDEIQDILTEVIPVIEEALAHSPIKLLRYSGTPKSQDNTISYYWNKFSTQNEWVMPCDGCNHWNIVGVENIGKKSLICSKCGNQIYPNHPKAQWASMRSPNWLSSPPISEPFEGYRIPQVITPWVGWSEILDKRKRYSKAQFYNEVLGMPFDSGSKPLTRETLIANCCDRRLEDGIKFSKRVTTFMGIDWGTAENSYTVMTIGAYIKDRFHFLFFKRFEGEEAEPEKLMGVISNYIDKYHVDTVGVDYGGGFDRNDKLIRSFGIRRIARYQYVNTKRIYFDKSLHRFMVNRTEALMSVINAINRGDEFVFPKWEDIEYPFASDMLSVFTEYNESRRTTVIQRTPGTTDDTLHSLTYCFLASMIKYPRPDIITPMGDEDDWARKRG